MRSGTSRKHTMSEAEIRKLALKEYSSVTMPASVYRLQLNHRFTFRDAAAILPYLKSLGIGALYLSPYFQATPKCLHGYDVTDPTRINGELGSQKDFDFFCEEIKRAGMTQVLDVVPNHMGIAGDSNQLWLDVLEHGRSSQYARFFDIDWDPDKKELKDKVLLPVLSDQYGVVLEKGEIRIESSKGAFWIQYWEHRLPVTPKSYALILGHQAETLRLKHKLTPSEISNLERIIGNFRDLPLKVVNDPEVLREVRKRRGQAKSEFQKLLKHSKRIEKLVNEQITRICGTSGDPDSFNLLDRLLDQQFYRMAYWRVASEEINYRRFFNVNELAAIRIEDQDVFNHHHKRVLDLLTSEKVKGLRIDHPDGLYDPPEYFRRLSRSFLLERLFERIWSQMKWKGESADKKRNELRTKIKSVLAKKEFLNRPSFFVVAEKILDRKESLPKDWAVHGTTGYSFLNTLNGLFVYRKSEERFNEIYEQFTGQRCRFDDLVYEKKKYFALIHMASEINSLSRRLDQISERNRKFRDFTLQNLTVAIRETIACFPVYRTYISPQDRVVSERDTKYINIAIEKAKRKTPALNPALYEYLKSVLLLELDRNVSTEERQLYRDFILRFQQLSAPITAKGVEDTAFYVFNRLISLNEVGGDPIHFGFSRSAFHRQNVERNKYWPAAMITSTTHDTKRSEDVRMRINVLSEMPDEWQAHVNKWALVNEKHKTLVDEVLQPSRNTEYFVYQTLIGIWPAQWENDKDHETFRDRIWNYLLKAVREAGVHTNWVSPNEAYEEAVQKFIHAILSQQEENHFLKVFIPFHKKIAAYGMLGSLSAQVVKIGSPGVCDFYQGSEIENLRLVDPDNRAPVDFNHRTRMLETIQNIKNDEKNRLSFLKDLFSNDLEQLKLLLIHLGLELRKKDPQLFVGGDYVPLEVEGEKKHHVLAFARKTKGEIAIVATGRFFSILISEISNLSRFGNLFKDEMIQLPKDFKNIHLTDLFSKRSIKIIIHEGIPKIAVRDLFRTLSVALCTT